jgi:hypothetical protein
MAINMEDQFLKLQDIILNQINEFYFGVGTMQYLGPVKPTSIISFAPGIVRMNALVLAEGVPGFYLPPNLASILFEAVIVHLDENFEFKQWGATEKELYQLNALIGDPDYSYDGTVDGAKAFFDKNNAVFKVMYRSEIQTN